MSSTPNVLQWPGNYHTGILWFFQFPSTASETQWLMFLQRAVRRSYNDNYTYVHFPQHRLTACHSVAKLCPALCNPMDCSEPCPLVFHHLPVCSNSCPLSQWCHLTISSSAVPFSSCPESFPASGSFPMSQLFASGGQSIGVSALVSVLPVNTQDWSPLEWTGWISLQSKGLSRVFSSTTVQKHQFFSVQPSLWSNSHIHTWLLERP